MKRATRIVIAVVLFALLPAALLAQNEELTLAGLAEQLMELAEWVEGLAQQVEELESTNAEERLAALETMVAPTPTVTPTATITPTATPDGTPRFEAARERVNVRSGPGTGFEVLGQVVQGDSYEIEGSNPAGDWYVFEFEGQRGWIYAPMLEVENRLAIPIAENVPSNQTPTPVPPTSTPTRRPTPVPTNTPPQPCNVENVPEPPQPHLHCEAWKTTYQLVALELGHYPPDSQLNDIAEGIYPNIVSGAQVCGVSPTQLGDYIYTGSQQLERAGKRSSSPDNPIAYLIGAVGSEEFSTVVEASGGCAEAIVLIVVTAE